MNSNSECSLLLSANKLTDEVAAKSQGSATSTTLNNPTTSKLNITKQKTDNRVSLFKTIIYLLGLILLTCFVLYHLSRPEDNSFKLMPITNFIQLTSDPGYSLDSVTADDYYVNATASLLNPSILASSDNPSVNTISFTSRLLRQNHLEIRMLDADEDRFELPTDYPFPGYPETLEQVPWNSSLAQISTSKTPGGAFSFSVNRKATSETLLSMNSTLVYTKYYLEFTSHLPRGYLYGLGERTGTFQLRTGTYTLWNRELPGIVDNGTQGSQTYGYHPMYLIREESGNFSLVFLKISNAMDVIIQSDQQLITFKIGGEGVFDIHILVGGPNPESVVKDYHEYIRGWSLPPFWSLGWHQCRWGYSNLSMVENVLENYQKYQIPLDVIWTDVDYMRNSFDFTIDTARFPLNQFNQMLETYQKRWVPIIDAGIGLKDDTYAIQQIENLDIGIKNPNGDGNFKGFAWPGDVYWVDYWHPSSGSFWAEMLKILHDQVPFSGVWLDLNEFANLCQDFCAPVSPLTPKLPYVPGGRDLSTLTLDIGALHYQNKTELNVHTFNGYLESKATYDYLKTLSPLPFILSRSTAYGSGQFANHWTGDNHADVEFFEVLYLRDFGL